jgi:hypothetical protein
MIVVALGLLGCRSPLVAEGHAAFAEGRLEEAVEIWSAAAAGEVSGVLAYDLGTAWYRKGDPARAIGWLRTAARLRPRDGNVHHNLSLARADLGTGVPEPVGPPVVWMAFATPGELGILGVLLAAIGSALLVVGRRVGGFAAGRTLGIGALAVGMCVGGTAVWGGAVAERRPVAVVLLGDTPVRDGPAIDAGVRFALPAGSEVWVERAQGPFLLLEDGRTRRGWIPADAVHVGWGRLRASPPPISAQEPATPG